MNEQCEVHACFVRSQITGKKSKPSPNGKYVTAYTSVLQAAEILCPEISSILKLSVFLQTQQLIVWMTWREIRNVSLKKLV